MHRRPNVTPRLNVAAAAQDIENACQGWGWGSGRVILVIELCIAVQIITAGGLDIYRIGVYINVPQKLTVLKVFKV